MTLKIWSLLPVNLNTERLEEFHMPHLVWIFPFPVYGTSISWLQSKVIIPVRCKGLCFDFFLPDQHTDHELGQAHGLCLEVKCHMCFWWNIKLCNRSEVVSMYDSVWGLHHTHLGWAAPAYSNTVCASVWPAALCNVFLLTSSCSLLLSAGELAGLHRRAGASRTPGPTASAQTAHETAADTAGHGAADRPVQLHMRASENSGNLRHHTAGRGDAAEEAHKFLSGHRDNDTNASARLGLFSTFLSDLISAAVSPFQRVSVWGNVVLQPDSVSYDCMNTYGKLASKIRIKHKK